MEMLLLPYSTPINSYQVPGTRYNLVRGSKMGQNIPEGPPFLLSDRSFATTETILGA